MVIYLDSNYQCHLENDGTMRAIETNFFDGENKIYIEGYRFIPTGETWTNSEGKIFNGEMITPIERYSDLCLGALQFDLAAQENDISNALTILGVIE